MNNDPEVKMFSTTRIIFAIFGLLFIILSPASSATILYSVSLDTSDLVGNAAGPFTLDFSLRDGSGNANNTVHLIDFNFLEGSFTLTDTSSPNERILFPALSRLSFRIDTTNNLDSPTPDSLIFRILDRNSNPIPTTDLTMSDTFLTLALNSATGTVLGYSTDHPNRTTITISAPTVSLLSPINVPEPSPLLLLVIGLSNLLVTRCSLGIKL